MTRLFFRCWCCWYDHFVCDASNSLNARLCVGFKCHVHRKPKTPAHYEAILSVQKPCIDVQLSRMGIFQLKWWNSMIISSVFLIANHEWCTHTNHLKIFLKRLTFKKFVFFALTVHVHHRLAIGFKCGQRKKNDSQNRMWIMMIDDKWDAISSNESLFDNLMNINYELKLKWTMCTTYKLCADGWLIEFSNGSTTNRVTLKWNQHRFSSNSVRSFVIFRRL